MASFLNRLLGMFKKREIDQDIGAFFSQLDLEKRDNLQDYYFRAHRSS